MIKKLTEKEKQEIRDKINRLNHLKEPYIKSIGFALPVFIAFFILMMGMINTQTAEMFDIKYNISLIQNNTNNFSDSSYGTIEPVKNINFKNVSRTFETITYSIIFAYSMMIFFIFYLSKYAKYDNKVTELYNKLVEIKDKEGKERISLLTKLDKLIKYKFYKKI